MRVLFTTSSRPGYMLPPRFADEQINCGPDWHDRYTSNGRVSSLATPEGDYDLARIAAKIPADQQPDVVVCLVDSGGRNVPRNLASFNCPRVLLLADTHHQRCPLIGMLHYLAAEKYDRVVFLYDRHHAVFFHAAGFRNLYWFPGLTFPHSDSTIIAARQQLREPRIAFVGQWGPLHSRRTRLLKAIALRGLPLSAKVMTQRESLDLYGSSLVGFNASLNGDLNLRIFEILASGAALITDRLSPGSGLDRLLSHGLELATYGDSRELTNLCEEFLTHPEDTLAKGKSGAQWFDKFLSDVPRRQAFQALAFDGVSLPEFDFDASETTRVFFGGDTRCLMQSVSVYEFIQELHRSQESVHVMLDKKTVPDDFAGIFATLPRVQVTHTMAEGNVDLAVFSRSVTPNIFLKGAKHLWCWDADDADRARLNAQFAALGFTRVSHELAVFCRDDLSSPSTSFQQE